jgi:FKBP-type peptidyl-prolyl cis-trans isomerase
MRINFENMKKIFYLLITVFMAVSFSACNNNDTDETWRDENTEAYKKIVADPAYEELKTDSGPTGVYRKLIKKGDGTEYPLQTSSVKVLYSGYYYTGVFFDRGTKDNNIPALFTLKPPSATESGTVRGFSFALQNMVVGDKYEIVIPYYLGYGEATQSGITGYTTLFFEVELVSITLYP